MRGGKREGAGRKKGSQDIKTLVKQARAIGINPDECPAYAYLRLVVMGKLPAKEYDRDRLEAAKTLLAYEIPRWGERKPEEPPKSEEELRAASIAALASHEAAENLVDAILAGENGHRHLAAALLKRGLRLLKSEGAEVINLPEAKAG